MRGTARARRNTGQVARAAIAAYLRSGRSGTCRRKRSTSEKPALARRVENTAAGQERRVSAAVWERLLPVTRSPGKH